MAEDKYTVGFKKYKTPEDKRLGTNNFEKSYCEISVKSSQRSNAGTAKNKFFSQLSDKDKKLTVVTGAIIY